MYKIETHLHTVYSSRCGHLDAEAIVTGYLKAGYHGVAVTDHFNRVTCDFLGIHPKDPGDLTERFLEGYHRVREEGEKRGLRVYKGAEFRFDGSDNDYLVYGFPDKLLEQPEMLFREGLSKFSRLCRREDIPIIQAHPYRGACSPAYEGFLDGVETKNRNRDWDNHNDLAFAFAQKHHLIQTSGSDCHTPAQIGHGGILAEYLPEDDREFISLLRSGQYRLL